MPNQMLNMSGVQDVDKPSRLRWGGKRCYWGDDEGHIAVEETVCVNIFMHIYEYLDAAFSGIIHVVVGN